MRLAQKKSSPIELICTQFHHAYEVWSALQNTRLLPICIPTITRLFSRLQNELRVRSELFSVDAYGGGGGGEGGGFGSHRNER